MNHRVFIRDEHAATDTRDPCAYRPDCFDFENRKKIRNTIFTGKNDENAQKEDQQMRKIKWVISWIMVFVLILNTGGIAWADVLKLPPKLESIEDQAFERNTALDEVELPEGIKSIGSRAFAESSVSSVNLPASIDYIAEDAFDDADPTFLAEPGTYGYQWAVYHERITGLAFNDREAYNYTTKRALFSDNEEIGLYHEGWIRNYQIANYDTIAETKDTLPEWNVEPIGDLHGALISYSIGDWAGEGNRAIDVFIDDEPEDFECELQYKVTCSWGDETVSGIGTLVYENAALPLGLDAPDEFHGLKVNEEYAFTPGVFPEDYSFGDFEYCDLWTDMDCDNWEEWENDQCVRYIRPHEAGIFEAWLVKRFDNIQLRKAVKLYVANEAGVVPAPVPMLNEEYWFDMAVSFENAEGREANIYIDDRTLGITVDNADLMRELYGNDYNWTFETLSGTETALTGNAEDGYFDFTVHNLNEMEENTESVVKATLTWGEGSASTLFRFNFGKLVLPGEINFEQDIAMTVGEVYEARVSLSPDASGMKYFLWYDIDGNGGMNGWTTEDCSAFYLLADEPGNYMVRPHIHAWDNAFIFGEWVMIPVADDAGNVPDPCPYFLTEGAGGFEMDIMIAPFEDDLEEGWVSRHQLFGWILDNLPQLYEAYGDDPEIVWGYEHIDGMQLALELVPWQSDRYVGDACNVRLAEMPGETGFSEFMLYCVWDGHRGEIPCRIYINEKPDHLPQTNTYPDEITVHVGETLTVTGHYPEGSYDVEERFWWIDAVSDYVSVNGDPFGNGEMEITGLKEGTVSARALVGVASNAYTQKPITIRVLAAEDE